MNKSLCLKLLQQELNLIPGEIGEREHDVLERTPRGLTLRDVLTQERNLLRSRRVAFGRFRRHSSR